MRRVPGPDGASDVASYSGRCSLSQDELKTRCQVVSATAIDFRVAAKALLAQVRDLEALPS